jgi:hypothetical protein
MENKVFDAEKFNEEMKLRSCSTDEEFAEHGYSEAVGQLVEDDEVHPYLKHDEIFDYCRLWVVLNPTTGKKIVIVDQGNGYSSYLCSYDSLFKEEN